MRLFTAFFAVISAGILFSSQSVNAEPKTDCDAFSKKALDVCTDHYSKIPQAPQDEAAKFCEGVAETSKILCNDGDVEADCQDQAVSVGASTWGYCLQYLKNEPAPQAQKEALCQRAGEIQARSFYQKHCVKQSPPVKGTIDI